MLCLKVRQSCSLYFHIPFLCRWYLVAFFSIDWTSWQTTKNLEIHKNIIYTFILRRWRLCEVEIQPERVRTYLSSVAETLFAKKCDDRRTHTGELTRLLEWPVSLSLCLRDQRTPPLRLRDQQITAFSPKLQTLNCLSSPTNFSVCGWLLELTYFRFFSGNLLILSANGNICHSIHRQ